jgi:hypothetical protein
MDHQTQIGRCACGYPHQMTMLTVMSYQDAVAAGVGGLQPSLQARRQGENEHGSSRSATPSKEDPRTGLKESVRLTHNLTMALALVNGVAARAHPTAPLVEISMQELERLRFLLASSCDGGSSDVPSAAPTQPEAHPSYALAPGSSSRAGSQVCVLLDQPTDQKSAYEPRLSPSVHRTMSRSPSMMSARSNATSPAPLPLRPGGPQQPAIRRTMSTDSLPRDDDDEHPWAWVEPDPIVPRDHNRSSSRATTVGHTTSLPPRGPASQHGELGRRHSGIAWVDPAETLKRHESPQKKDTKRQPSESPPKKRSLQAIVGGGKPALDAAQLAEQAGSVRSSSRTSSVSPMRSNGRRSVADAMPLHRSDLTHAKTIVHEAIKREPSPQRRADVLPFRF